MYMYMKRKKNRKEVKKKNIGTDNPKSVDHQKHVIMQAKTYISMPVTHIP